MRLGYYTDGEKQGTLIDMYTPTMMGFELPYEFLSDEKFPKSRWYYMYGTLWDAKQPKN